MIFRTLRFATVVFLAISNSSHPPAVEWYVDASVADSGDGRSWETAFQTIQEGIDAAFEADTVIVAEGTYIENVRFEGKKIVLCSRDPLSPEVVAGTIIDGDAAGPVVRFSATEDSSCVLSGFTLRNGDAANGGGVCGGTADSATRATIRHNVIVNNQATPEWPHGHGGGLAFCDGTIRNNTVCGNAGLPARGLAYCNGTIQNCIIWGSIVLPGGLIHNSSEPMYSCIQDWAEGGEGNIAEDPGFVDADGPDDDPLTYDDNDCHLRATSPCIDAGRNEGWMRGTVDLDGNPCIWRGKSSVTVDIGAYEYGSFPFRLVGVTKKGGGGLELSWNSRPGDTYIIESCLDIASGVWNVEATVPSQGESTSLRDSETAFPRKFYRIAIE
jgi:hypothetical protein